MLKLYDLECPRCHNIISELLEYDSETHKITEEILCERCMTQMKPCLTNPIHGKHGSWGLWKVPLNQG